MHRTWTWRHSPQKAGESRDAGIHGDSNISHCQTENEEIAGGPQFFHFAESHDSNSIEDDSKESWS